MFEKDDVIKAALGEHLTERFLEAKRNEVLQYNLQVSRWEIDTYLGRVLGGAARRKAVGGERAGLRAEAAERRSSSSTGSRTVPSSLSGDRRHQLQRHRRGGDLQREHAASSALTFRSGMPVAGFRRPARPADDLDRVVAGLEVPRDL